MCLQKIKFNNLTQHRNGHLDQFINKISLNPIPNENDSLETQYNMDGPLWKGYRENRAGIFEENAI